jgi:hypothetical protein
MQNSIRPAVEKIAGLWSDHWAAFNTLQKQHIPLMWEKLNEYVLSGSGLE